MNLHIYLNFDVSNNNMSFHYVTIIVKYLTFFSGTKERRIPYPTINPMTQLFRFVSCPNYTYEACAWLGFSIMTQCLPGNYISYS